MPTLHRRAAAAAFALIVLVTVTSMSSGAAAQTWAEVGDAGDVPGTVQTPLGLYALNQITGTLSSPDDVDLYCLEILNAAQFSAQILCLTQLNDPSLWLFHFTGLGSVHIDLCAGGFKAIPPGIAGVGTYYLAVGGQNREPLSPLGPIWINGLYTGPRIPDGPGAAGNLNGWTGLGAAATPYNYSIMLQGASYCGTAVPTTESSWGGLKAVYR